MKCELLKCNVTHLTKNWLWQVWNKISKRKKKEKQLTLLCRLLRRDIFNEKESNTVTRLVFFLQSCYFFLVFFTWYFCHFFRFLRFEGVNHAVSKTNPISFPTDVATLLELYRQDLFYLSVQSGFWRSSTPH